ncbi:MAG: hypothetical protein IKK38_10960 [Spirochaetaceae bacterium]|nr:hypothetical protein [Spirochaetaceae bacterium]
MKNFTKVVGLLLALTLLTACGGGGGGGGGSSSGTAANVKSTYTGNFTVNGQSYNTLVMEGTTESGTATFAGSSGSLTGSYSKTTSASAMHSRAAFDGSYTITYDAVGNVVMVFTGDSLALNDGSGATASGSGNVSTDVFVAPHVIATAQANGIQFVVLKPTDSSFATGIEEIKIQDNTDNYVWVQIWNPGNSSSYSLLWPLCSSGKNYKFEVTIRPMHTDNVHMGTSYFENIEITAKGGIGNLDFNKVPGLLTTTPTLAYSSGTITFNCPSFNITPALPSGVAATHSYVLFNSLDDNTFTSHISSAPANPWNSKFRHIGMHQSTTMEFNFTLTESSQWDYNPIENAIRVIRDDEVKFFFGGIGCKLSVTGASSSANDVRWYSNPLSSNVVALP